MSNEAKIGALLVEVSANIAKYQEAMKKTQDETQKMVNGVKGQLGAMEKHFGNMGSVVNGLKGALAGLGVALSAGAFAGWVKSAIDAADEMGKMSQKIGLSVENLSGLKYAGELADVSLDQLGVGMKQLSKNILEANAGGKDQKAVFAALGISNRELKDASQDSYQVLLKLADQFAAMPDGATKTALAMKVFGKSGADLIPLLNAGAAGLAEMRGEGERLGVVMSTDMAKSAEEFNDNITRLRSNLTGVAYDIARYALPGLADLSEELNRAAQSRGWDKLTRYAESLELIPKWLFHEKEMGFSQAQLNIHSATDAETSRIPRKPDTTALDRYLKSLEEGNKKIKTAASLAAERKRELEALRRELDKAKEPGGLYEWFAMFEENQKLANFQGKLQMPELKAPKLGLGFDNVVFKSLEEQAEAAQAQKDANQAMLDDLTKLAQKYDQVYGIQIPSALDGAQAALAEYGKFAADSTSRTFEAVTNAMQTMEDGFVNFIKTGKLDFSSLVDSMLADLTRLAVQKSITGPLSDWMGGMLDDVFGSAKGNAFSGGEVLPFAKGGIVTAPTMFPMARGLGLMGEAGPEAILPLARTRDGALGVRTEDGGNAPAYTVSVTNNLDGFNRLSSELRNEVEDLVVRILRRHS